jgi:hypothetical protein
MRFKHQFQPGSPMAKSSLERRSKLFPISCSGCPVSLPHASVEAKPKRTALCSGSRSENLLWYCYLDQDQIDSSFFHLDLTAGPFQRLPSLDVIRYVIGFHDEKVAEIEAQLETLRGERLATSASIDSLARVLKDAGVESELQIQGRVSELRAAAAAIQQEIEVARFASAHDRSTTHAVDRLREQAFSLGQRVAANNNAIQDLLLAKDRDTRHLNEIETLSLKFMRSQSARAVLAGVAFHSCPKCTQTLPDRPDLCCDVCGQSESDDLKDSQDEMLIRRDIKSRGDELRDIIKRHDDALTKFRKDNEQIEQLKRRIERERNEASERFDTAYLSTMLVKERERASLLQDAENMSGMSRFPKMLDALRDKLAAIQGNEVRLRISLKQAREDAEKDSSNLESLKTLFLDCLVRASVPGISENDTVQISPQNFLPEIVSSGIADGTVASFATLSSGGKKTLFKCCFALALHRLAVKVGAPLPEFLMIDSPMKNISERENREQFKGFYNLVYSLKVSELQNTQFVLIDKEFTPPSKESKLRVRSRHMKPLDDQDPPLIPYYRGN